jgi:tRNA A-37 threonylcarbamoyl transferase component Bud32
MSYASFKAGSYRGCHHIGFPLPDILRHQSPAELIKNHGQIRKSNAKIIVAAITTQEYKNSFFIKAYSHSALLKKILNLFGINKARRIFTTAHRLRRARIAVPKPYGYCFCPLIDNYDYLFFEALNDAKTLLHIDRSAALAEILLCFPILALAGKELANLHRSGYVHGDFKWGNLLVDCRLKRLVITDLDSVTAPLPQYRLTAMAKDIGRFVLSAEEAGLSASVIADFTDAYFDQLGITCKNDFIKLNDRYRVVLATLRRRHRQRYPERYR